MIRIKEHAINKIPFVMPVELVTIIRQNCTCRRVWDTLHFVKVIMYLATTSFIYINPNLSLFLIHDHFFS